jgi:hypothetical protein
MNKLGIILLPLIPGVVFAKDISMTTKVRVTARMPENVLNTIPAIQTFTMGLGAPRINLTIDSERNAIEVLLPRGDSTDILIGKLKSLLGEDVYVEKMTSENMAIGTQDDVMKP